METTVVIAESKIEEYLKGKRAFRFWLICTVLAAASASVVFEVPKYTRLLVSGHETTGRIADLQPERHGSVIYEYQVVGHSYKGAGHAGDIPAHFDELRVGQEVPVFFNPRSEDVSCLGEPGKHVRSLLMLTLFLATAPTFFLLAIAVRRMAR